MRAFSSGAVRVKLVGMYGDPARLALSVWSVETNTLNWDDNLRQLYAENIHRGRLPPKKWRAPFLY